MQKEATDQRDRAILHELMRDGRLTNAELADRVNLSPSACLRRVRAMEESGLIAGYVMLLDTARANMPGVAFVSVTLKDQGRTTLDKFETAAPALPGNRRMLPDRGARRLRAAGRLPRRRGFRAHPHPHPDPVARRLPRAIGADLAHGQAHHRAADLEHDPEKCVAVSLATTHRAKAR